MKQLLSNGLKVAFLSVALLLVTLPGCDRVNEQWELARNTDTPEAYEVFQKQNPRSSFAQQGQLRREALLDYREWSIVQNKDLLEGIDAYLTKHPKSKWAVLARMRREALRVAASPELMAVKPVVSSDLPAKIKSEAVTVVLPLLVNTKFILQLGAFSTYAVGQNFLADLQQTHSELKYLNPNIIGGLKDGKKIFRIQVKAKNQAMAIRVCAALLKNGKSCMVVRPQAEE